MSDPAPLSGRTAVVTGATRGLGRVTAFALAEAGAEVMVVSRKADACAETAAAITDATGRRTVPYACHLGRWEGLDGLAEAAYGELGRVDVLVNNAGMSPLYDQLVDVDEALWRKVIDVNLSGPFRLTSLIGTRMKEDGGGSIINISSVAAANPPPSALPYAAAKAGLNALTGGFARAFGPEVRVNSIVAGAFLTDVSRAWDKDRFAAEAAGFALRRGARPEEIVGTILYLAGDASSYTTGSLISVDGGYLQPPEH